MAEQCYRERLISELVDEVHDSLFEFTTQEIEKLHSRFIVMRSADMETLFRQEVI